MPAMGAKPSPGPAAARPAYADGSPIREGDQVLIEQGSARGRVCEIVLTPEAASALHVRGTGIVVDAHARGLVFLSVDSLHEDPPEFVGRGPGEGAKLTLAVALGFGALFLLPAFYSLLSAIASAVATGEVLVISVGRTETYRKMVPWPQGWARFAGPPLLLLALVTWDGSRGITARWWFSGTLAALAIVLLAYSAWFTSWGGSAGFTGLCAFIAVAFLLERKWANSVLPVRRCLRGGPRLVCGRTRLTVRMG